MQCPTCHAPLETPLACGECGALLAASTSDPFELFGLPQSFALELPALRKRLIRFSRWMHPDYFGSRTGPAGEALRLQAEKNTAQLNRAYELLSDDFERASWMLERAGGPGESEERAMPQAFLMEVLEWNEALEAAREAGAGSSERAALDALAATLAEQRSQTLDRVGQLLAPGNRRERDDLVRIRRELNAVRYLEKTLTEIESLRVEQASSSR
jgi:molecular chaperone HscB